MTTTQKISWINEKISSLIEKIKLLQKENTELKNGAVKEVEILKKEIESHKVKLKSKDDEIRELKIKIRQREDEIDDVVAKIDLLINS